MSKDMVTLKAAYLLDENWAPLRPIEHRSQIVIPRPNTAIDFGTESQGSSSRLPRTRNEYSLSRDQYPSKGSPRTQNEYSLSRDQDSSVDLPPIEDLGGIGDIDEVMINIAPVADTTMITDRKDDKYDFFKTELGMNIIVPQGYIDELRFKISLEGKGVVAIDGFPKDNIRETQIRGGTIKIGIDKALNFIPVMTELNPVEFSLGPWEFNFGTIRHIDVDFGGALNSEVSWYFRQKGINNDLKVALTIKKPKELEKINSKVIAMWAYKSGKFKKQHVQTDKKSVTIL